MYSIKIKKPPNTSQIMFPRNFMFFVLLVQTNPENYIKKRSELNSFILLTFTLVENFKTEKMNTSPENYKWGIFYFNPEDPRVIVPKNIQWMGWTLNFARPAAWLIILAFIALIFYTSGF